MLKNYFNYLVKEAGQEEVKALLEFAKEDKKAIFLDLGCGPKHHFQRSLLPLVKKIQPQRVIASDIVPSFVKQAQQFGFEGKVFDFEKKFPFPKNYFDVILANQVIEHLVEIDHFLDEIRRVLKPHGYVLLGTENLSSWYNIFPLFLGWQPFSTATYSKLRPIGNPLSLHLDDPETRDFPTLGHVKLMSFQALVDLCQLHRFKIEKAQGLGFYPLPPFLAKILSQLDLRHAARLVFKLKKTKLPKDRK